MSNEDVDRLATLYTDDITQGSPFNTGTLNAYTPQFKRLSSVQGDLLFHASRRFFQKYQSGKQNTWTYLSKRLKNKPLLGSMHTSDLANTFEGGELADYLINFVTDLDPNGSGQVQWPKYTTSNPQILTFLDGDVPVAITQDTYRQEEMEFVMEMNLAYPL